MLSSFLLLIVETKNVKRRKKLKHTRVLRSLLLSIVGKKKKKYLSLPNTKFLITRNYRSKNEKKTKTNQSTDYLATLNCRNKKKLTLIEYKAPHNSQLSERKKNSSIPEYKFTRYSPLSE